LRLEYLLDPEADPDGDEIPGTDLRPSEWENALVIWSRNITAGEYNKVLIYVSDVRRVLVDDEDGKTVDVKLPSKKLQVSRPFTISDSSVNFVYDITVVKAGKSGNPSHLYA